MKMFIKNSSLFLIFFLLLLSKNFLYSLFIPKSKISIHDEYVKRLEKEIENIQIVKNAEYDSAFVYGKVLYQNPYKFKEELIVAIDSDNLAKNDYVINEKGLIGTVDKVYKNMVVVKMITNKEFLLQVKINDCYGILKYLNKLVVTNINNYCNITNNMNVYTSNLGYLDEEILIGRVTEIIYDENEISNSYVITPTVNLNNLNYVIIITKDNK